MIWILLKHENSLRHEDMKTALDINAVAIILPKYNHHLNE